MGTVGNPNCKTRVGRFTGQVICTSCGEDCEHYICTHEEE
jgi:hypothetical protein